MARKALEMIRGEDRVGKWRGRPAGKAGGTGTAGRAGRDRQPANRSATGKRAGKPTSKKQTPVLSRALGSASASRVKSRKPGRQTDVAALTEQMQRILQRLDKLPVIQASVQALSDKLDAALQQLMALGDRDPGDVVPPGVAVQSPAPLSAEDRAVLEKLEEEPESADTELQRSD